MGGWHVWIKRHPAWAWGLSVGFLPVLSGILFRTYSYHVTPDWYEVCRQFDALFVMFEVAVILIARERGMNYGRLVAGLSTGEKIAACTFLATFWISSIFVSQVPALSAFRVVAWCIHIAFGCSVFYLSATISQKGMERFSMACFLGLCAYVPLLVAHFAFPPEAASRSGEVIVWSSALPGYLSVRLFGFTTAVLALMAIGLLWPRRRVVFSDWWVYAGLVLSLTLTFWSGTRGGIYAILLGSLALPFLARERPRFLWLCVIVAATVVAWMVSEMLYQPNSAFGLVRSESGQLGSTFTTGRYDIWLKTIALIAQRPLLGWGESAIMWLLPNDAGNQQPHNALLQMLLSWGAVATAAALYLIYRLARVLVGSSRNERIAITPTGVLVGLAVMSSVDGILYNPRTAMLAVIAAASALAIVCRNSNQWSIGGTESADAGADLQEVASQTSSGAIAQDPDIECDDCDVILAKG